MNVGRILQRHSGSLKGWSQGVITYSSVFAIFFLLVITYLYAYHAHWKNLEACACTIHSTSHDDLG